MPNRVKNPVSNCCHYVKGSLRGEGGALVEFAAFCRQLPAGLSTVQAS
jgi:hypothetical protein